MTLQEVHLIAAWFLILSNAAAGVWALAAQYIEVLRGRVLWWAVGVAQMSTFLSATLGVLMVSRNDLELDQFHALYGFTTIFAVGILYSYRGSPFIKDKQFLLYGFGSLFIMGLGIRNFFLNATVEVLSYIPMP